MTADLLEPMRAVPFDPVDSLPPPEIITRLLGESRRRSEVLKSLLRIAKRKAHLQTRSSAALPQQEVAR